MLSCSNAVDMHRRDAVAAADRRVRNIGRASHFVIIIGDCGAREGASSQARALAGGAGVSRQSLEPFPVQPKRSRFPTKMDGFFSRDVVCIGGEFRPDQSMQTHS